MRRTAIQYAIMAFGLAIITMFDVAVAQSGSWNTSFRFIYVVVIVLALQYDSLYALLYGVLLGCIADLLQSTVFGSSILIHILIVAIVITLRHTWFKQQSIAVWGVFSVVAVVASVAVHYVTRLVATSVFRVDQITPPNLTLLALVGSVATILIGVTIVAKFIDTSKRVIII